MKISVNDNELYTLTEIQKQVIADYIPSNKLEEDLKRRLEWVLMHLYQECFKIMKNRWEPILTARGAQSLPTDKDAFAALVFAEPDYKDRLTRDNEAQV